MSLRNVMQSKIQSIMESAVNVGSGFIISFIVQTLIMSAYGVNFTLAQNFSITVIFTVTSFIRSYIIRRVFNKWSVHHATQN
jgi:hypothetical protein